MFRGTFEIRRTRGWAAAAVALLGALAAVALASAAPAPAPAAPSQARGERTLTAQLAPGERLEATIRRTSFGVPHILADDFKSVAYGFAYAFAEDNLCTIAESYVTVNAERSRFFGPDASWEFRGNGSSANNLNSDFFYQRINDSGIIERLVAQAPPQGPKPEIKAGVDGYVEGYNQYLREVGVDNLPDPRCRGEEWVRPITADDVYRRFYQLASLASAGVAIDGIGAAAPAASAPTATAAQGRTLDGIGPDALRLPIGSNAYGLGREATDNGKGMVLGNPHFPWDDAERLYQAQLTIPGELNVSGGTLYGVPLILIGSTDGLAWSHTVSTAYRFTPVELTLPPGDQYSYVVDGETRQMEASTVTVKARAADGGLEDRTRTLYSTEYGPMFTEILGLPLFPWTPSKAYAMHDVNEENFRYLNHFFDNNLAQSVREYDAVQRRYQGVPWVNSIAADSGGESYYSMGGAIPNVPDAKVETCSGVLGAVTFEALGLPTLDGSRSECDWDTDPDAVSPGIFAPSEIPRLFRNDYVHNGNDSHWLSNPAQPLEGFARIIGDERAQRTLRTRVGVVQVQQRLAGTDGRSGERFTLQDLQDVTLGNRQYAGELWRDELVELCETSSVLSGSSGPVDVSAACSVLADWDLRDDLDSNGAILFRRFARRALSAPGGLPVGVPGVSPYDEPFDVNDPVNTPRGLNTNPLDPGGQKVRQAFADAVSDLRDAGIPLDAPLRGYQYERRGEEEIPIHGGPGTLGVFNAINVGWNPPEGYPNVPHGSSFVMATRFRDGECPVDMRTFVSYGNSESPTSPHNSDYTRAFSDKQWYDVPTCEAEIAAHPGLRVKRISAAGPELVQRRRERGDTPDRDQGREGSERPERRAGRPADRAVAGTRAVDDGSLPFTGLGLAALGLLGAALAGAGVALRARGRERTDGPPR